MRRPNGRANEGNSTPIEQAVDVPIGHIKPRRNPRTGKIERWRARYPDPVRGGTAQIEKPYRSKDEAREWLRSQVGAMATGQHVHPAKGKTPLADIVAEWEKTWKHDLAPRTQVSRLASLTVGQGRIMGNLRARWPDRQRWRQIARERPSDATPDRACEGSPSGHVVRRRRSPSAAVRRGSLPSNRSQRCRASKGRR